jgi:hypothetical protein
MRIISVLTLIGTGCLIPPIWTGEVFGIWKTNAIRSTNSQGLVVRFERHSKGEVFTVDRIERDGRATTSSTILYLDSREREFQGFGCSGIQWSKRLDSQTVEIFRTCATGESTHFVRRPFTGIRSAGQTEELVLEITEQRSDGRRFQRRLILEKQSGVGIAQSE